MWQKIKCFFGFHTWVEAKTGKVKITGGEFQHCIKCSKTKVIVHVMCESDLYKMYERGEISCAAYLKSVKDGFTSKDVLEMENADFVDEFMQDIMGKEDVT